MFQEPFYGLFLIQLNKKIADIPTACVSKRGINFDLTIGEKFWNSRNENQRIGLLKHELLHIVFFHLLDWAEFHDKALLNIAMDLEVNQYIKPEYYPSPDIILIENPEYASLNLPLKAGYRKYYELIQNSAKGKCPAMDKLREDMEDFRKTSGSGSGDPNKVAGNSHISWEELTEGMTEAEKKLIKKQIDYQLKETAENVIKNRGLVPSELDQYIKALYDIEEPVMDWKAYVRRFSGNSNKIYTRKTRKKPNKRFPDNPALKIKTKKHIAVGIDTSGSVSDTDLIEFFSELHHIHKTGAKITIIECDAAIHRVYEYKGGQIDKVSGRGGTSFQPIIDYVNERYKTFTSLVYLTDMECPPPTKCRKPTLWVACSSSCSDGKGFDGHFVKIQR